MFRSVTRLNNIKILRGQRTFVAHHSTLTNITESNGVREIVLNDTKTRNSLSMTMMQEIQSGLTTGWEDKFLRCIVLAAKGHVFSAGHNFRELSPDTSFESHKQVFLKLAEIIKDIMRAPVPIIAKVDGLAAAGGLQLVASCDMVISSDKATYSAPGATYGLFCTTPGIALARIMPPMKCSYMLFTSLPISAQEAYISGLVSSVVPSDKLDEEVEKVCCSITTKSREVIKLGKEFYYKQINMGIEEAYQEGAQVMAKNLDLDDGREGVRCFLEKRKPQWKS